MSNNKILGLLGNKKCEVTICASAFAEWEERATKQAGSGKPQSPGSWMGHRIDDNMAKAIPPKTQLILEQSVMNISESSESTISLVATRIIKLAPTNDLSALFSVSPKNEEPNPIVKVEWGERGMNFSQIIEGLRNANKDDVSIEAHRKKP